METSNLVSVPVVKELLIEGNYKEWRVLIKNYLLSQDLWDIVENSAEPSNPEDKNNAEYRVWRRKNAEALHVIQVSCGAEALSLIMDIPSAKRAWEALKNKYTLVPAFSKISDDSAISEVDYEPLYKAVQDGNWDLARWFLENQPEGLKTRNPFGQTVLHIATVYGPLHIVKELVKLMPPEAIELKDGFGGTAFLIAAGLGIIEIAEDMITKNPNLVIIPTKLDYEIPVTVAVIGNQLKMAHYLYSITPLEELKPEKGNVGATLLIQCFLANILDLALNLLQRCPSLAITPDYRVDTFVYTLAGQPSLFPSGYRLLFWQRWIYNWIQIDVAKATEDFRINITRSNTREIDDKMSKNTCKYLGLPHQLGAYIFNLIGIQRIYKSKLNHKLCGELLRLTFDEIATLNPESQFTKAGGPTLRAAQYGIHEFIDEAMKVNMYIWTCTDNLERTFIFHAIKFRQAKVVSRFMTDAIGAINLEDRCKDNLLHVAEKLEPSTQLTRISGAALQMQRELQWFKEIKNIVPPARWESRNNDGMTARELFTISHKDLVKEGEEWMKETATSCTVVAALIITIMFAVSFTIPGGNDQNTGYPMFKDHKHFKLFIIFDAISLFSSTTSVLMFLGILTSRYAEDDFLKSLPAKLIIVLSMLFISIAAMMITFAATISIMLPEKQWIIIPVILFACVHVSSFAWLQFSLLVQIFLSTYGPGIIENLRGIRSVGVEYSRFILYLLVFLYMFL